MAKNMQIPTWFILCSIIFFIFDLLDNIFHSLHIDISSSFFTYVIFSYFILCLILLIYFIKNQVHFLGILLTTIPICNTILVVILAVLYLSGINIDPFSTIYGYIYSVGMIFLSVYVLLRKVKWSPMNRKYS